MYTTALQQKACTRIVNYFKILYSVAQKFRQSLTSKLCQIKIRLKKIEPSFKWQRVNTTAYISNCSPFLRECLYTKLLQMP